MSYLTSTILILTCFNIIMNGGVVQASSSQTSSNTPSASSGDHVEQRCEKITIPMCMDIGYNFTSMPNLLEMETQEEAGLEVHQFWPLVEINCSEDLKFFLCSMYAPICIEEYQGHIPSCQSVCERAREGCTPIMIQYGFNWPDKMNCSELPVYGDNFRICMDPKKGAGVDPENHQQQHHHHHHPTSNDPAFNKDNVHEESGTRMQKTGKQSKNSNIIKNQHHSKNHLPSPQDSVKVYDTFYNPDNLPPPPSPTTTINNGEDNDGQSSMMEKCRCNCLMPYFIKLKGNDPILLTNEDHQHQQQQSIYSFHFQQPSGHHFNHSRIETAGGLAPMCAVSCKGAFNFTDNEQETALFWIGITALICSITCLLTVFTSLTDTQRFRYPERAIIFLAACYVFISGGYLLRIRLGPNAIACDGPFIRYQRTGPTPASCVLSFILLYFFGMASAYWWLILTLTWFLAAGLKWSSEAITSYAQYFHLLAWLLPTAQSVAILCLGAIDGDPFLNVCTVGNQSRANLLIFVITPLCVCIAIGVLFLLTGFVALFRIRRAIQQTQHTIRVKTDKLEKLMIRIGLSSFLYIVPEVVVVACHIYEYIYRPLWEKSLTCACTGPNGEESEHYSPQFALIVLKYIMSLIIGITSSFWIWSSKTLESWMRIYMKVTCCSGQFGSPASSRSGASQLLPNMASYYGRGVAGLAANNSSLPMKTQTVNLGPISVQSTPQHLHHHNLHQNGTNHHLHSHHLPPPPQHHHHHHHHHQLHELQQSRQGSMILPPPPSIPPPLPPPPPPLIINNGIGGGGGGPGSLTGSQFTHINSKHPLSHV